MRHEMRPKKYALTHFIFSRTVISHAARFRGERNGWFVLLRMNIGDNTHDRFLVQIYYLRKLQQSTNAHSESFP